MKQLLLRVDDALHARLAEQAAETGMSVNALAGSILGLGIDPLRATRQQRLTLRLVTIGAVGRRRTPQVSGVDVDRSAALESMRGVGPIADALLDDQRS